MAFKWVTIFTTNTLTIYTKLIFTVILILYYFFHLEFKINYIGVISSKHLPTI